MRETQKANRPKRTMSSRYNLLPRPIKFIFVVGFIVALVLFIFHWFGIPIAGRLLSGTLYSFLLYAVLGFNVFMGIGATKATKMKAPPWYDYALSFTLWGIIIFLLFNSEEIGSRMWEPPPTSFHFALAVILGGLALEAGRRVAGWGFLILLLVCIAYPLVADKMPGALYGFKLSFADLMGDFAFGANGLLGLPAQIIGNVVLPFFLFAGSMLSLGGGEFFMNISAAIGGRFRGGPAKVAVLASGFFGSLSGGVLPNIATTGSLTIPAMKKLGYPPHYAAAIEACASTGGDVMPPIMGGSIFLMIVIAGVNYSDVAIAAFLPSVLYYLGLLVQVDGYAYKHGLKGLNKADIPRFWPTLKSGWLFIICLLFLVFALVYMRWGIISPLYTVGLILILQMVSWLLKKSKDWNNPEYSLSQSLSRVKQNFELMFADAAGLTNFGMAIFLGLSFLLVGLYKTGVAASITTWVIALGGANLHLILLIAVVYSILMGMVGLQRVAYLFLAVTMCPAVIAMGVNTIGIHLFLIFYAQLGGLTLPVAIYSYVASTIAGADYYKTGWTAMRMSIVLAIVPWYFVYQPAMLIVGSDPLSVVYTFIMMSVGLFLLASGLEGCLVKIGGLTPWERALLIIGGFIFVFPNWLALIIGGSICVLAIALMLGRKRLQLASPHHN